MMNKKYSKLWREYQLRVNEVYKNLILSGEILRDLEFSNYNQILLPSDFKSMKDALKKTLSKNEGLVSRRIQELIPIESFEIQLKKKMIALFSLSGSTIDLTEQNRYLTTNYEGAIESKKNKFKSVYREQLIFETIYNSFVKSFDILHKRRKDSLWTSNSNEEEPDLPTIDNYEPICLFAKFTNQDFLKYLVQIDDEGERVLNKEMVWSGNYTPTVISQNSN